MGNQVAGPKGGAALDVGLGADGPPWEGRQEDDQATLEAIDESRSALEAAGLNVGANVQRQTGSQRLDVWNHRKRDH